MLAAILFFIVAEIYFSVGAMRTSNATIELIEALNPSVAPGYYLPSRVPPHAIIVFVVAHVVLYGILGSIVWSISKSTVSAIG
jgi:hypothetical protein